MMFRFADPGYLLLLPVIPVLYWLYSRFYINKKHQRPVMMISETETAAAVPASFRVRTRRLTRALAWLTLLLLVLALCRPQWGEKRIETLTEGINMILAIDLSGSMRAMDFKTGGKVVDRLTAVKSVVADFIAGRFGDRIGMVVFGTSAYTQVPLTRDYKTIAYILDRLEIGAAGDSTAIGDAVGISIKRLQDIESESNIIILLTDGDSNAGELTPEEATALAAERGIKIYTVGVGSRGRAPFPVDHPLLGRQYVYQEVGMDEAALKRIAEQTGGLYFRAEDSDSLKKIYEAIDNLETTTVKVKVHADYREFYGWLVAAAVFFLALRVVAENTVYLEVP